MLWAAKNLVDIHKEIMANDLFWQIVRDLLIPIVQTLAEILPCGSSVGFPSCSITIGLTFIAQFLDALQHGIVSVTFASVLAAAEVNHKVQRRS